MVLLTSIMRFSASAGTRALIPDPAADSSSAAAVVVAAARRFALAPLRVCAEIRSFAASPAPSAVTMVESSRSPVPMKASAKSRAKSFVAVDRLEERLPVDRMMRRRCALRAVIPRYGFLDRRGRSDCERARQKPFQGGIQFHAIDGLGQVVIHAGSAAFLLIPLHGMRRERDDGNAALARFQPADLARCRVAVHLRHLAIHDDEIELSGLPCGDGR